MLLFWLFAALVCIVLVETALRLPLSAVVGSVVTTTSRSLKVVGSSRISDHWKEKAMGAYARATFAGTIRLALLIALILGMATALVLLFDKVSPGFTGFMLGWLGIGFTVVFASLYYFTRQKLLGGSAPAQPTSAYSAGDKLLHRLALDNAALASMAFNLDQGRVRQPVADVAAGAHIFVSGLARAGTTVLMRRFHASGRFRSLTYRDMPFVLAPNLWRQLPAFHGRKR